jgi:hypothetical protein
MHWCGICNYFTFYSSSYNNHLKTHKHILKNIRIKIKKIMSFNIVSIKNNKIKILKYPY